MMEKKKQPTQPYEIPSPEKLPEIEQPVDPAEPVIMPEAYPEKVPDEAPFEKPPYEFPPAEIQ